MKWLPILASTLALSACSSKKASNTNGIAAPNTGATGTAVSPADPLPDSAPAQPATPQSPAIGANQVAVTGTLAIASDSTVIAYANDGSAVHAATDKDGHFTLAVDRDKSYAVVVVPGVVAIDGVSLTAAAPLTAKRLTIAGLGLDSLPTQVAAGAIDVGKLAEGDDGTLSATADSFDQAKFLTAIGTTEGEAKVAGANDDASSIALNIDSDGNGKLDIDEGKRLGVKIDFAWHVPELLGFGVAKTGFIDLDAAIASGSFSTIFTFLVPWQANLPDAATLTFPAMKVCAQHNAVQTCSVDGALAPAPATTAIADAFKFSQASNPELDTKATDQIAMGPKNNIPAAQYSVGLNTSVSPSLLLVAGDYSVDLGNGTTYSLKGFKPRVLTDLKGLAFLSVKFAVGGDSKISGIDYGWKINDLETGKFRDATTNELRLLYKGADDKPGHLSCSNSGNGGQSTNLDCSIGIETVHGSVAAAACSKPFAGVLYEGVGGLSSCYVSSRDVFGSQVAYQLTNP